VADWPLVPLGEVIRFVGSGATPRGGKNSYQESGIALIRSMNVFDLQFETQDLAFLSEDQAAELNRVTVEPADVLLNITGASVARCCIAPDQVLPARVNQHVLIIRTDPEKCDPYWLSYALASPYYKACLLNLAGGGATREALTKGGMKVFEVALPAIQVQRRVAAVLASVDSLIENNRRRIEFLEETARLLYREWFVNFRYPGHEDIPLVDSELGPVPEGWETGALGDLVEVVKDTVDPETIPADSPVVGLEHLPRRSTTLAEWDLASEVGSRRAVFRKGDILFGKIRPYFHKVVETPFDGFCSTDAVVLRPLRDSDSAQVLAIASCDDFIAHASASANGTKMPRANMDVLMRYPVPRPTESVGQAFEEAAKPLTELAKQLIRTNSRLTEARDLLLPRLVSGDLDISDLELDLEAVG
jgi:type I restriction enzyme, S subunit